MYNNYNFAYKTVEKPAAKKEKVRISYDITEDLDFQRLLSMFEIVVVDVWAQWCEPCKRIAERYEETGRKHEKHIAEKRLVFLKDDIDSDCTIHRDNVEAVPTFFIYYKEKLYKKITGSEFVHLDETIETLLRGEVQDEEEPVVVPPTFEGI
jgi:thioredoxin 1